MTNPSITSDTAGAVDIQTMNAIERAVDSALHSRFGHYLEDISFRIGQLSDMAKRNAFGILEQGKVYAEDLNLLGRHLMTGYVVTNNSPAAGSIAWVDIHIVYGGQDFAIADGNSNLKYHWWSPTTTPGVLQSSNTKPTLAQGEVLVLLNASGTHKVMLSDTNTSLPGVLGDGAVDQGAILANAVGATQIAPNAVEAAAIANGAITRTGQLGSNVVDSTKIADGAVTRAGQLGANVVDSTKLADGAVTRAGQLAANVVDSTKLADGAIARAGQLGTGVVTNVKIGANAVEAGALANGAVARAGQLGANVVDNTKLADGAVSRTGQLGANVVDSTKLANGAVSRAGQLGQNVVTTTAIADSAVGAGQIAGGSVGASKLSILRHVMY